MLVAVRVKSRRKVYTENTENMVIEVDSDGTVGDIAYKLSSILQVPLASIVLILCGKKLTSETTLSNLFLGPQTSLTAVLVELCVSEEENEGASSCSASSTVASFQAFCKNCNLLKRAKLRVYCDECSSSSVVVTKDPECWDDVLQNLIQADCKDCEKKTAARFCFKCIDCGQVAVPLTHIRGSRKPATCPVCYNSQLEIVVELNCHHQICLNCFTAYIKTAFTENQFTFSQQYGYTVSCPLYDCRGCVVDTHCFYLLGKLNYDEYHRRAAERFVYAEREGTFCPRVSCGAAFLVEFVPSYFRVTCPECHFSFCSICLHEKCICLEVDATKVTIERTCRKCPGCSTPTERSGGCAHMHCMQCGEHWCFLCVKRWSEDCQWNHWFD